MYVARCARREAFFSVRLNGDDSLTMRVKPLFRLFVLCVVFICASAGRDFYKILGIDRQADDRTLKKAYRQMALKHHPDKGGSEEMFAEIALAYDTLSDSDKRRVYDQYGEDGVKQHEQGGSPGGGFGGGFPGGGFGGFPGGGGGQQQFTFQFGGGGGGRGGGARDPFDIFAQMFGDEGMGGRGGGGGGARGGGQQNNGSPQSKENLFNKDSPVKSLKNNKFPGSDAKHVWLIEFYAPWCQHCKRLKPTMEKLAGDLKDLVKIGAVNCEKEKQLCGVEGVSSFPVIKIKKGSVTVSYDGERDLSSLKQWALEQLPVKLSNIRKQEGLDAFLNGDVSQKRKQSHHQCGSERVCVIYFSDTTETPAWLKVASHVLKGKFNFAEVRARNEVLALAVMDVVKFPSLVVVCGGNVEKIATYSGELRHEMGPTDVTNWVESYAFADGTGLCYDISPTPKTGTKLDDSLPYETMRVSKLKAVLSANKIPCVSCAEKSDFTRAIREAIKSRSEL